MVSPHPDPLPSERARENFVALTLSFLQSEEENDLTLALAARERGG
jgi:hypothetical protein